jgi:hypothetical protein
VKEVRRKKKNKIDISYCLALKKKEKKIDNRRE